jgi:hypothetical protein
VNQPQILLPILDIALGEPSNLKKSWFFFYMALWVNAQYGGSFLDYNNHFNIMMFC